ncbi:MAG TPA: gamma-glutamyl-phosphate reductase, partial [Burkholderiales bacterium]|nr:gamma-glutamyl-phosphate reductase [Burkholderiales bacterium]
MASKQAKLPSEAADISAYMHGLGRAARAAARELARAGTDAKNRALRAMASEIRAR